MNLEKEKKVREKNKLTDSVFFQGIFVCIINIVLCIVCLSTASWAWFYDTQTVAGTTLRVTDYDLKVNIYLSDNSEILPDANGVYDLEANEDYYIVFEPMGTSGNGYAIIYVGDLDPMLTELIPITDPINRSVVVLTCDVDSQVKFDLRWGTTENNQVVAHGDKITVSQGMVSVAPNS